MIVLGIINEVIDQQLKKVIWMRVKIKVMMIVTKLIKQFKIMMEQEYRYPEEGINYLIRLDGLEVDIKVGNLVILVSEDERRVFPCEILSTESEEVSHLGLGYVILKTNNNHKVQGEGVCWRITFASFMRRDDLEAGARADCSLRILTKKSWVELSLIINPDMKEQDWHQVIAKMFCIWMQCWVTVGFRKSLVKKGSRS
jgi:hypothetical protein